MPESDELKRPPLSAARRDVLRAAVVRLLPSEDGPGAAEAGVAAYVEQAMASPWYGPSRDLFEKGLDLFQGLALHKKGKDFVLCDPAEQDEVLGAAQEFPNNEARRFFEGLIHLVLEGFLCDPVHGGNRGKLGWRHVGFDPEDPAAPLGCETPPSRPGGKADLARPAGPATPGRRSRETRDVLVIGSGAGGGPLALALSAAGAEVLALEKGPHYRREDFTTDELSTLWRGMFVPSPDEEPHMLVHAGLAAARPSTLGWIASCVGGGTVHMGASLLRFHPDDFRMRSRFGEYEANADWPYSYEDLEPYYSRAEWEVGVSGLAGSNPHEGRRSRPYPMPPLDDNSLAAQLDAACRRLGLTPYPTPRGINSRPYQGRPACSYCWTCAGFGCRSGARGSAPEALLSRAESTGRCEIRPLSMVREITVDRRGRASGCIYIDGSGREHEIRAKVVCVCCSAVESARLLLLSTSSRFPQGLGNGGGLVGRNLQFHCTSMGKGVFGTEPQGREPFGDGNPFLGRSLMDHYFLPEGVSDLGKGGVLIFQMAGGSPILRAKVIAQQGPRTAWGEELKRRLREEGYRVPAVGFEVHHDFIPNEGTYVALDPEVRDKWGLPVARIHLSEPEHHRRAGRWLVARGLEVLQEMGAGEVVSRLEGATSPYLVHGTCRAGRDPATSVLDEHCQVHEVPNLFVVDGSFMPTSGGSPPTLTILANSFRTADHILARAKRGSFG